MDAANPLPALQKNTWRTQLLTTSVTRSTLMTHAESIERRKELGVKFTPELKSAKWRCPTKASSASRIMPKLIEEYKAAGLHLVMCPLVLASG